MMQPVHHGGDASGDWAVGDCGPGNQDHRQCQATGCLQLGQRPRAARVFGDDMGDGMGAHQIHIGFHSERPAIQHHFGIRHGQSCIWGIDQSQQVEMLGLGGKSGQRLLADGKKNAGRRGGQGGNGAVGIWHMQPLIPRLGLPRGTFVGDQGNVGHFAGRDRVAADLGGKGVRGIDDMGDCRVNDVIGKTLDAAVTAQTGGQGLFDRIGGASGVGKDGVDSGVGKGVGKGGCLCRATQKKDAHDG